jgi:2-methylisocitrate lyase-like PEP mutase family enzyme
MTPSAYAYRRMVDAIARARRYLTAGSDLSPEAWRSAAKWRKRWLDGDAVVTVKS